jgi:hypothetical protein
LRFSHKQIGERCQDLFHSNSILFNGDPAIAVTRVCAGLGRTPVGTPVLTYAAEEKEAESFPFELDIPQPGLGLQQMPKEHPIQPKVGITLQPLLPAAVDMRAIVHSDLRLCVPRIAFEALLYSTGRSLRGGSSVWVRFDSNVDHAVISLDQSQGATSYDLSTSRGRILFPKPTDGDFTHGDIYQCHVTNDELVVDLSGTVQSDP